MPEIRTADVSVVQHVSKLGGEWTVWVDPGDPGKEVIARIPHPFSLQRCAKLRFEQVGGKETLGSL